jgi:hypothetical protein
MTCLASRQESAHTASPHTRRRQILARHPSSAQNAEFIGIEGELPIAFALSASLSFLGDDDSFSIYSPCGSFPVYALNLFAVFMLEHGQ